MKKLALIICIALGYHASAQTDKKPQTSKEAITPPKVNNLVITTKDEATTELPLANGKLNMKLVLQINGTEPAGLITITKDGNPFKTINYTGVVYPVELDLHAKYQIKCSKQGYIPKVVVIDTDVPAGRENSAFAIFKCSVELFKEDGKTKVSVKPVGQIKFNKDKDDFDSVQ